MTRRSNPNHPGSATAAAAIFLRLTLATLAASLLPSCGLFRDESPNERDARYYRQERDDRVKSQEYYKKLNHRKARKYQRDQRYDEWFNTIMQ